MKCLFDGDVRATDERANDETNSSSQLHEDRSRDCVHGGLQAQGHMAEHRLIHLSRINSKHNWASQVKSINKSL